MYNNHNSLFGSLPPITKNLIIINALFWLAAISLPRLVSIHLENYLGLHYWQADGFNPVQFVTYMFMHSTHSFGHLFFNMFGVFMFGRILEYTWGSKRFLTYYMVTGIGAAIIQQITWTIDIYPFIKEINTLVVSGVEGGVNVGDRIIHSTAELLQWKETILNRFITVGASGSVFGLLLAFGMLFPNQPLYLMFIPVPIKAKYFVIGYAVIELVLGVGNFSFDNIAHFAHLGGMIFGYFLIIYWRKNQFR